MAEQNVVEPKPKKLLRCEQGHTRLLGRSVAFSLIAPDTGGDQVLRGRCAALGFRKNVVQSKIPRRILISAILAFISVANIDTGPFHRIFAPSATDVNIVS